MKSSIAAIVGMVVVEAAALLALVLAQVQDSPEWIVAILLVPVVLASLFAASLMAEARRRQMARIIKPILAVLGFLVIGASFAFNDRDSLGFVFPFALVALNLDWPQERARAFSGLSCGALLLPLSNGNDVLLLVGVLVYGVGLVILLNGAFFRRLAVVAPPTPDRAGQTLRARHRLVWFTCAWTCTVVLVLAVVLSWLLGDIPEHPLSLDLPPGGVLLTRVTPSDEGAPLLPGEAPGKPFVSGLLGKLRGPGGDKKGIGGGAGRDEQVDLRPGGTDKIDGNPAGGQGPTPGGGGNDGSAGPGNRLGDSKYGVTPDKDGNILLPADDGNDAGEGARGEGNAGAGEKPGDRKGNKGQDERKKGDTGSKRDLGDAKGSDPGKRAPGDKEGDRAGQAAKGDTDPGPEKGNHDPKSDGDSDGKSPPRNPGGAPNPGESLTGPGAAASSSPPKPPPPKPPPRCTLDVLKPSSSVALRPIPGDATSSTVLKIGTRFPIYVRERAYSDYEDGRWLCDLPYLQLNRGIDREDFKFDYPGQADSEWQTIELMVPFGTVIPEPLRTRRIDFPSKSIDVTESHTLQAPGKLPRGLKYRVESVGGYWQDAVKRAAGDGASKPDGSTFLTIPENLRPRLQEYLNQHQIIPRAEALQSADALEDHFRTTFVHTLETLGAQGSQEGEPIEAVLRTHRGHSEMIASAFLMLARQLNIQGRLVTGYVAERAKFSSTECCFVHRLDAHTWVELKVNNIWTTFDPVNIYPPPTGKDFPHNKPIWRTYLESLDRLAMAYAEPRPNDAAGISLWESASTSQEQWLIRLWHAYLWLGRNWWLPILAMFGVVCLVHLGKHPFARLHFELILQKNAEPRNRILALYAWLEAYCRKYGVERLPGEGHARYLERCARTWKEIAEPIKVIGSEFGPARYADLPVTVTAAGRVTEAARTVFSYGSPLE